LLVSAFILVTGGIRSDFSSLYLLPIIAATVIRSRSGGLQVAALSACGYFAIVASQYVSMEQFPLWVAREPDLPAVRFAQYVAATNVCGFVGVALLAGSLAEGLRSADARLVDASAAMADLRAFNAHVIDSLVSGLVTADAQWRVLSFNRAAFAITGVSPEAASGRDARQVLALPPAFSERLASAGSSRGRRADYAYATGDGRTIDLGLTAAQLYFPDGTAGHLFTFQDVTDVKRLERDAGRRERLAAVGEMAAGIAHEIRNPLASMSGSMQVLRSELSLNGDQAELMDIVLKESERLNTTIQSFLAYARPKRPTLARLDLAQLVADTARLLQNGADVHPGHRVDVDVPPHPVWCETDGNQVRQVLWNLATNGLRAMSTGGRLRLSVSEPAGGGVEIEVRDQGCGIAPEDLDRIFQPFHSTFERGTGLGLATVHRIVADLRGTISVKSTVGQGTTMCVRLPQPAAGEPVRQLSLQEAV
jgi:two-component system sensor histidine kinase PilS (NtrC family)